MKSIYLSVFAAAALLFTACSSDESTDQNDSQTGTLTTDLSFEGVGGVKAASSTAVPTTSWSNVKQVQIFVYNGTTGDVVYSAVKTPTAGNHQFTWTDIPAGTGYTIGVVANVKSSTDAVTTYKAGSAIEWDAFNVRGFKVNSQLHVEMKKLTTFAGPYEGKKGTGDIPYTSPSEIFTAYKTGVNIASGTTVTIAASDLALKREVAMMRVRVNHKDAIADGVTFNNTSSSILISRNTSGFEFPLGTNKGGIKAIVAADKDRIIEIAGSTTFKTADPTAADGYKTSPAPVIIGGDFKLWRDVIVFPNVTKSETSVLPSDNVDATKQYFIMVSALAPVGYVPYGSTTALTSPTTVYWYGIIEGAFKENYIREVNLSLKSKGIVDPPVDPTQNGKLIIELGEPEEWNSAIQSEDIDL